MSENDQVLQADAKPATVPSPFDIAEKTTKALALLIALAYGLGMLVSNQYLMALGTSDFSSLRPKYVITGVWTLLLILLVSSPLLLPIAAAIAAPRNKRTIGIVISFIIGVALCTFLIWGMFRVLGSDEANVFQWRGFWSLIATAWTGIGLGAIMIRALKRHTGAFIRSMYSVVAVWTFMVLVILTIFIARGFYDHVPEAMGGGKPVVGLLVLNKDGEAFWTDIRISGTHNTAELQFRAKDSVISPRSRVAKLYYEDEHRMVVSIDDSHGGEGEIVTMILSKSLVDAFVIGKQP